MGGLCGYSAWGRLSGSSHLSQSKCQSPHLWFVFPKYRLHLSLVLYSPPHWPPVTPWSTMGPLHLPYPLPSVFCYCGATSLTSLRSLFKTTLPSGVFHDRPRQDCNCCPNISLPVLIVSSKPLLLSNTFYLFIPLRVWLPTAVHIPQGHGFLSILFIAVSPAS